MKLFKKLFSVLVLCICCAVLATVAGCNTLSEGDGWVEVQSITYTTEKGSTTLTSQCEWSYDSVEIEKAEYDSAPIESKAFSPSMLREKIDADRKSFKSSADNKIGSIYFLRNFFSEPEYEKITLTRYTLNYVKVKVISDKVVEIDYNKEVKEVSTISYEITYFEN